MEALYLDGSRGRLFTIYHPAAHPRRSRLGLVYLPPFAEEMNRARRMAALQARRLAQLGIDVLLLDPFGTGDSAGDFGEARWEGWCDDVRTAIDWLGKRTGGKVGLWGLRLGALLAADVAAATPSRIACLVLWQPVLSGDRYLTQFLRLRVAATMDKGPGRESTNDLKMRLSRGTALEIAGYELAPALASSISSLQLQSRLEQLTVQSTYWLEVAHEEQPSLTLASQKLVGALEQQNRSLIAKAVSGEPFWTVQEITLAPNLLQATDDMFRA
jgi:exosortase A-associated hydrolase 2